MELLKDDVSRTRPQFYYVDKKFLKELHDNCDSRIPVKWHRVFVALAVYINGFRYLIPLTSTTNEQRIKAGKKPRRNDLITKIYDSKGEIADLLYSSMFPAKDQYVTPIKINPLVDTYLSNEERYIRKHWIEINNKALSIYRKRYKTNHRDYHFLKWICCDYKKIENYLKTLK